MEGPTESAASTGGRILIAGGTGFVGSSLRQALSGRPLRILSRHAPRSGAGRGEDIEFVQGDVSDRSTLGQTLNGCQTVINLVAIIVEEGGATFDGVIRRGTENLVEESKKSGVTRYLQMSALGARNDPSYRYFNAKWQAEEAVKSSGIAWTIFRPSIIFGPGDGFVTMLADLVRSFPVVPVAGSGESKFQPVAVGDVTGSIVAALDDPTSIGKTYDLGGPDVFSYDQMLDLISRKLNKKKPKVHVPVGLLRPVVKISKPLPKALRPPVTEEQLKMLSIDNSSDHSDTERLLGRAPLGLADNMDYILTAQ